jgi:hypothetical protein
MGCTPDMLEVIKMPAPKGKIPDGMKVTALEGPDTLQSAALCPAISIGSFTLWPMSYIDNRVSFGMVMYNPQWEVVSSVEKQGARYVYQITIDGSGTATVAGQANQSITMSLNDICNMLT